VYENIASNICKPNPYIRDKRVLRSVGFEQLFFRCDQKNMLSTKDFLIFLEGLDSRTSGSGSGCGPYPPAPCGFPKDSPHILGPSRAERWNLSHAIVHSLIQ